MSEQRSITLEFLASRVAALTDQMRDLELRFTALEARVGSIERRIAALSTMAEIRFDALDRRFAAQEERTSQMLAILTRIAARIET
jgi:hypothetical protein